MSFTRKLVFATLSILLLVGIVHAEKGSQLSPILAKPGKVTLEEHFDGSQLPKGWVANKGSWQIKDGTVVGQEKKEDMHAAVLTLQQPFKSAIVRFSFKRDGATNVNLSFNHAKGHLFRIVINDDGLTINKDKDQQDAASKPLVLAKAAGKFPMGQWHTMQVEIQGDKVAVTADNGIKAEANHPGLAIEKTGYRFVTKGASLLLDDLTIWQVAE